MSATPLLPVILSATIVDYPPKLKNKGKRKRIKGRHIFMTNS